MSKFTEGPWINMGGEIYADDTNIATAWAFRSFDGKPLEKETNARLIAAAPEMYETIKSFLQISNNDDGQKCFKQAKELLARIDGDNLSEGLR